MQLRIASPTVFRDNRRATMKPVETATPPRWYSGVTGYEWLVLAIASAGWVFDTFEGQIFNLTRGQMLAEILGAGATKEAISRWGDIFLGVFLAGGTLGGIFFGWLGDKWGRRPTMVVTILMYSIFSGLTYFATDLFQVGVLRFLVAMGVGGEWAVAAALVAEVFPKHARAHASGIFHGTSILGTWLAALAGIAVGAQWRYAYLLGVVPALLILWVRASVKEPETWKTAKAKAATGEGAQLGSFRELLLHPVWGRRAILGMLLAAVGLGSFWGVTVAGQDLAFQLLVKTGIQVKPVNEADGQWSIIHYDTPTVFRTGETVGVPIEQGDQKDFPAVINGEPLTSAKKYFVHVQSSSEATLHWTAQEAESVTNAITFKARPTWSGKFKVIKGGPPTEQAKFAYGIVQAAGGGLGMLAFGPICVRLGRKRTFILMQIAALLIVPVTCFLPANYNTLLALLPLYGFFTLSIHAGFAIYFPELFPNHLRSTGTGFCFNGGRLLAATMLIFSGWLKSQPGMALSTAITLLSLVFVLGIVITLFLPETKDLPLPE